MRNSRALTSSRRGVSRSSNKTKSMGPQEIVAITTAATDLASEGIKLLDRVIEGGNERANKRLDMAASHQRHEEAVEKSKLVVDRLADHNNTKYEREILTETFCEILLN